MSDGGGYMKCFICLQTDVKVMGTKKNKDGQRIRVYRCGCCGNMWDEKPKKEKCPVCGKMGPLDCSITTHKGGDIKKRNMCRECMVKERRKVLTNVIK